MIWSSPIWRAISFLEAKEFLRNWRCIFCFTACARMCLPFATVIRRRATGFAAAGYAQLNFALLPEIVVGLGQIPLRCSMPLPARRNSSAAIEPYVPHYDALLLANHGAVTCGPDLLSAFFRMETIEHFAKITLAAENARHAQLALRSRSRPLDGGRARGILFRRLPVAGPSCSITADYQDTATNSGRKCASLARTWTR